MAAFYCYARPTHSYLNLSPGLDFETQIIAKHNIAEVLRASWPSRATCRAWLNIGSATDCYQPVERELKPHPQRDRGAAAGAPPVFAHHQVSGVERDLDLLAPLAAQRLAAVYVTITTLDAALARRLEPRAAAPHRRLRTIRALADAGVPVGVSVAPQIPFHHRRHGAGAGSRPRGRRAQRLLHRAAPAVGAGFAVSRGPVVLRNKAKIDLPTDLALSDIQIPRQRSNPSALAGASRDSASWCW
jgi:hypothetical protein